MPIAIVSVSDKAGVVDFARGLEVRGFEIYSTGGTRKALHDGGVRVRGVSDLTGFPEILDGRVKTLHPAVHGGILARRDLPAHLEELRRSGIQPIDLVAVNLYPFAQTVARPGVTMQAALEQIDIGGPTLIRAAAKNFPSVSVVVDPADYEMVLNYLSEGEVPLDLRRALAAKAFQHVAAYDTVIAEYIRGEGADFPRELTVAMDLVQSLRYGENPHQRGAFYALRAPERPGRWGVAAAEQLHGKELSYNNILDADAAWSSAVDFEEPACAVVKHTNPCGLAVHEDPVEAYQRALRGDPISAFGGIVAFNRPVDGAIARALRESKSPSSGQRMFYEIVLAPDFTDEAVALLSKARDLRILRMGQPTPPERLQVRSVGGGALVQTPDTDEGAALQLRTVTRRAPSDEELRDLRFAWRAVRHVKSNAIVVAKDRMMLGMGSGQPNRVVSVRLALEKAGADAPGAVLASDAFFPFSRNDSVEIACQAGVTAFIHPGGSLRDQEGIDVCDEYGAAMVLTGARHFRH